MVLGIDSDYQEKKPATMKGRGRTIPRMSELKTENTNLPPSREPKGGNAKMKIQKLARMSRAPILKKSGKSKKKEGRKRVTFKNKNGKSISFISNKR